MRDSNASDLPAKPRQPSPRWLPPLRAEWLTEGNARYRVWVIPADITPAQRADIAAYEGEVAASLSERPGDEELKAKSIARLYAVLASDRVPDEYLRVRMETWLDAIDKRPAWEIGEAAMMWIRGHHRAEDENRNFVPRPAQLLRLADIARNQRQRELSNLSRLARAIPESEFVQRLQEEPMPRIANGAKASLPKLAGEHVAQPNAPASIGLREERIAADLATRNFPPAPSKSETPQ